MISGPPRATRARRFGPVAAGTTDPDLIGEWGGGPADVPAEAGAPSTLWGGHIYGAVTAAEPPVRLVQEWRGDDEWDNASVATFELAPEGTGMRLTLAHTNVPDDEAGELDAGWDDCYLGPLINLLGRPIVRASGVTTIASSIPLFFVASSFVALAFLVYSLLNLERLGIGMTHPRVLVEAVLVVVFALAVAMVWQPLGSVRRLCGPEYSGVVAWVGGTVTCKCVSYEESTR